MLAMDHVEAPLIKRVLTEQLPDYSVVVIAGAYKGDTVDFVHEHNPDALIEAYEPQDWAYEQIDDMSDKVIKHNVALALQDGEAGLLHYGTDACTLGPVDDERPSAMLVDTRKAIIWHTVHFFIMNMEGYEYTLLPYLLQYKTVERLLVQYHGYKGEQLKAFRATRKLLVPKYFKTEVEVGKGWYYYE